MPSCTLLSRRLLVCFVCGLWSVTAPVVCLRFDFARARSGMFWSRFCSYLSPVVRCGLFRVSRALARGSRVDARRQIVLLVPCVFARSPAQVSTCVSEIVYFVGKNGSEFV